MDPKTSSKTVQNARPLSAIQEIMTQWITLSDGCRLAARIWLPQDADQNPVPAILEYLPYRRRDGTICRDEINYPFLAQHGYAGIRVDIRGTGDSDGFISDEYTLQEQDDALEVIEWISKQSWCMGNIGMWGISWGGFNALQVAARRPPALKAIMTLCSTDDRYADDAHYNGGCLMDDNLKWGTVFLATTSLPPDPEVVGENWREIWFSRLEKMTCYPELWMRHQQRDFYWQHGSVCENYDDIQCAVYAVGGWADGYANTVPRLLNHLSAPCKGLIGPWGHAYPHLASPGPAIDFLNESLRWWDYWLKDIDTGIMDEPKMRVWAQEHVKPAKQYQTRPGYWIDSNVWPPEDTTLATYYLNTEGLKKQTGSETILSIQSPLTTGVKSGDWCSYGKGPDQPGDQRTEDGQSLCFDTELFEQRTELIGAPVVKLKLSSNQPKAFLVARLCDVAPDGSSLFISYGVLNMNYRNGFHQQKALVPGKSYQISIKLDDCAHIFPKGHRARIAFSTNYWPMIWPSPESPEISIQTDLSQLELPIQKQKRRASDVRETFKLPEPFISKICQPTTISGHSEASVKFDAANGKTQVKRGFGSGGVKIVDIDLVSNGHAMLTHTIYDHDPLTAVSESQSTQELKRDQWNISTKVNTKLSATKDTFILTVLLEAYEDKIRVFVRNWNHTIPRETI
jgi:uncharacterized protein